MVSHYKYQFSRSRSVSIERTETACPRSARHDHVRAVAQNIQIVSGRRPGAQSRSPDTTTGG